jgi:Tfp pilus assembly protein PilO
MELRMQQKKILAKTRLIWRMLGGCVTAALILAGFYLSNPLIIAQEELKERLTSIESLKETGETVLMNLTRAEAEVRQLREKEVQRFARSSPKNDETAFLEWANSQSKVSGLEVRDFRPSNRELSGDYVSRTVVLSTQGSYESICNFLDRLRECPYMLRITNLEILPQNQGRVTFGATFNILLFTANPQQAFSPVKQG